MSEKEVLANRIESLDETIAALANRVEGVDETIATNLADLANKIGTSFDSSVASGVRDISGSIEDLSCYDSSVADAVDALGTEITGLPTREQFNRTNELLEQLSDGLNLTLSAICHQLQDVNKHLCDGLGHNHRNGIMTTTQTPSKRRMEGKIPLSRRGRWPRKLFHGYASV